MAAPLQQPPEDMNERGLLLALVRALASSTVQSSQTIAVTSDGTIGAGATSITFMPQAGSSVTVEGVALAASSSLTKTAALGNVLPAIPFTVASGTMNISIIR